MEATVAQALFTLAMFLIFGGFLAWALRTRQFRDVEEANRRLFGENGRDGGTGTKSGENGEVPR